MTSVSFNPAVAHSAKFGSQPVAAISSKEIAGHVAQLLSKEAAKDTMTISTRYLPTLGTLFTGGLMASLAGLVTGLPTAFISQSAEITQVVSGLTSFVASPLTFKQAAKWFLKVK